MYVDKTLATLIVCFISQREATVCVARYRWQPQGGGCRCAARGSQFISNTQPVCKQLATAYVLVNDEVVIVSGSVAIDAQDKQSTLEKILRDWCP